MSNQTAIGFLGLGQMGAPMAERLLAPDVRLHVFDPRPEAMAPFVERGAVACASPAAVAAEAEIVFACLPSPKVSEAVAAEVAAGPALRLYAEMSTIGREAVERIAALLASRGIACVDAPISGGPASARAGGLAMLAAGAPDAVAALRPWQLRIGRTVYAMGARPGQAQVMKLVNNLLLAANLVAACEGLAMGAKAGLDPDAMLAMVNAGTGRSLASERILEEVLSG
ncbi:MAG: NAD(P)-dependent oxidoreductase, partial [Rhodospirillales bacterium]|nr:NAD(P)-dependent oxidoreductase [Rhodospirillales bacterium]